MIVLLRGTFKETKEQTVDSDVPVDIKTVVTFFDELEVRRVTNKGHSTTQQVIPRQAKAMLRAKKSIIFGEEDWGYDTAYFFLLAYCT